MVSLYVLRHSLHYLSNVFHSQAMVTDGLSIPMTILRTLLLIHGATYLETLTLLEVHLLGAEMAEMFGAQIKFEELLHWLPACKQVDIVMVVAKPSQYTAANDGCVPLLPACAGCTRAGAALRIRQVNGLYHDAVAAGTVAPTTAQVIFAGHSGLHDTGIPGMPPSGLQEMWAPTVRLLATTSVPCIWTSYSATEAEYDARLLQRWGGEGAAAFAAKPFPRPATVPRDWGGQPVLLQPPPLHRHQRR